MELDLHDGVGDTEVDVDHLTDRELFEKLRYLGANIGPITETTRAVYQRKLRRWLQYGPTPDTSTSDSTEVEPHVDVAVRSKMATASENSAVRSVHNNNIEDSAGGKPVVHDSELKSPSSVSTGAKAMVGHVENDISPVRLSKSEVMPKVQPYTMSFAECGSEPFSETDNGWFVTNQLKKPKAKTVATDEPDVTPYDIEMVDRVMLNTDTTRSQDDGTSVRKRFSTYNLTVTPRPSLREYKDSNDGSICLPDLDEYRSMMSESNLSASTLSPAPVPPVARWPRSYCDCVTDNLLWVMAVSAVLLFIIWAVVYNMEPAFVNPIMQ